MQINKTSQTNSYFKNRNIDPDFYQGFTIPSYLTKILPKDLNIRILDIGCGFGQMLSALGEVGYKNLVGIDISAEAVSSCIARNLKVIKINDIIDYATSYGEEKFAFIIMSHVLEHIEKDKIIKSLKAVRENLLAKNGQMVVMVPNAQADTGCYWAYEDFTHTTLFTAGSLSYVLKAAGFETVILLDPDCTEGLSPLKRLVKKLLLKIYILRKSFWNRVTSSYYHKPSSRVFSYELKVLAK
jgi:2-polyprenyl-3-methyl-5-hydroxy-6-metoxy-1,4-benzoquinol methylase